MSLGMSGYFSSLWVIRPTTAMAPTKGHTVSAITHVSNWGKCPGLKLKRNGCKKWNNSFPKKIQSFPRFCHRRSRKWYCCLLLAEVGERLIPIWDGARVIQHTVRIWNVPYCFPLPRIQVSHILATLQRRSNMLFLNGNRNSLSR